MKKFIALFLFLLIAESAFAIKAQNPYISPGGIVTSVDGAVGAVRLYSSIGCVFGSTEVFTVGAITGSSVTVIVNDAYTISSYEMNSDETNTAYVTISTCTLNNQFVNVITGASRPKLANQKSSSGTVTMSLEAGARIRFVLNDCYANFPPSIFLKGTRQ